MRHCSQVDSIDEQLCKEWYVSFCAWGSISIIIVVEFLDMVRSYFGVFRRSNFCFWDCNPFSK